jgi:hypothetical protein
LHNGWENLSCRITRPRVYESLRVGARQL